MSSLRKDCPPQKGGFLGVVFCCIISAVLNKDLSPEQISRRGEGTAWTLALIVGIAIGLMGWRLTKVPPAAWIFFGLMVFSALSTSLGNWMDRKTLLRVDGERVSFKNGVRRVSFGWDDIRQINVIPLRWGKSVQVIGDGAHFEFRTLGEVQYQDEVQGRLGFAEGEAVLKYLLEKTNLSLSKEEKGRYYYSRA
jgi:hypothetical protein